MTRLDSFRHCRICTQYIFYTIYTIQSKTYYILRTATHAANHQQPKTTIRFWTITISILPQHYNAHHNNYIIKTRKKFLFQTYQPKLSSSPAIASDRWPLSEFPPITCHFQSTPFHLSTTAYLRELRQQLHHTWYFFVRIVLCTQPVHLPTHSKYQPSIYAQFKYFSWRKLPTNRTVFIHDYYHCLFRKLSNTPTTHNINFEILLISTFSQDLPLSPLSEFNIFQTSFHCFRQKFPPTIRTKA